MIKGFRAISLEASSIIPGMIPIEVFLNKLVEDQDVWKGICLKTRVHEKFAKFTIPNDNILNAGSISTAKRELYNIYIYSIFTIGRRIDDRVGCAFVGSFKLRSIIAQVSNKYKHVYQ